MMKKMKRLTGLFAAFAAPALLLWTYTSEWQGRLLTSGLAVAAQTPVIPLRACGANPNNNTLMLQQAITSAPQGATLVLPSGVCVLAKCAIAQGAPCYTPGAGRYDSAVEIGRKHDLTLTGAADGTSRLKLDPNPPRAGNGNHGYCGEAHVLSLQNSSFITLRNFTVDGSDGELPEDKNQCNPMSNGGRIAERMFGVYVLNSTDVALDRMKLIKAHGDGLNLMAEDVPLTERITVTNSQFLANDRAGLTFQRNVGYVTIKNNYFKNSGADQDLDMEATGGQAARGPYEVDIDHNTFERTKPGLTVTLGAGNTQPSSGVRFTNNTIRAAAPRLNVPSEEAEGGCIFVFRAHNTLIANNTIIGARRCTTLAAQKVTDLRVINNQLTGYANVADEAGLFRPRPVLAVAEDVAKDEAANCGGPPTQQCYRIHYPDRITITGNTIIQHVRHSPGIDLNNVDELTLADNSITHTNRFAPVGQSDPANQRAASIDLSFGVPLSSNGYFVNERTLVNWWSITGNRLSRFADGVRIQQRKAAVSVSGAEVNSNVFNTAQSLPQGIWLLNASSAGTSGFIHNLTVDGNQFGCGFGGLGRNAYVRPNGQGHRGNIGERVACQ